jgi:hypothetical protein
MSDETEVTPLDFLEAVYLNPNLPLPARMRAAIEAAPYKHPKLSASANVHYDDTFAAQLKRAIERSKSPPPLLNAPKTIEHEEIVPAEEMKAPFTRHYRRFVK